MLGIWSAGLVLTPVPTFEKKKRKKRALLMQPAHKKCSESPSDSLPPKIQVLGAFDELHLPYP